MIRHQQALQDAHELIDHLATAGWLVMIISNIHRYTKDLEDFTVLSFSVEKKIDYSSQGALPE